MDLTLLYWACEANSSDQPFFSTQKRHTLSEGCLSSRCVLSERRLEERWPHSGTGHKGGWAAAKGAEEDMLANGLARDGGDEGKTR